MFKKIYKFILTSFSFFYRLFFSRKEEKKVPEIREPQKQLKKVRQVSNRRQRIEKAKKRFDKMPYYNISFKVGLRRTTLIYAK
jgi:hypothetical protein